MQSGDSSGQQKQPAGIQGEEKEQSPCRQVEKQLPEIHRKDPEIGTEKFRSGKYTADLE